jgi:hypothetical protein
MPWLGYHFWMSTFTVVHHTAPHIPFKPAEQWNAAQAQLSGTVDCEYPRWVEFLCHDISVHVPHHVSSKIPWCARRGRGGGWGRRARARCAAGLAEKARSWPRRQRRAGSPRRSLTASLCRPSAPQPNTRPPKVQPAQGEREPEGQLGRVHDALHLQLEADQDDLHRAARVRREEVLQVRGFNFLGRRPRVTWAVRSAAVRDLVCGRTAAAAPFCSLTCCPRPCPCARPRPPPGPSTTASPRPSSSCSARSSPAAPKRPAAPPAPRPGPRAARAPARRAPPLFGGGARRAGGVRAARDSAPPAAGAGAGARSGAPPGAPRMVERVQAAPRRRPPLTGPGFAHTTASRPVVPPHAAARQLSFAGPPPTQRRRAPSPPQFPNAAELLPPPPRPRSGPGCARTAAGLPRRARAHPWEGARAAAAGPGPSLGAPPWAASCAPWPPRPAPLLGRAGPSTSGRAARTRRRPAVCGCNSLRHRVTGTREGQSRGLLARAVGRGFRAARRRRRVDCSARHARARGSRERVWRCPNWAGPTNAGVCEGRRGARGRRGGRRGRRPGAGASPNLPSSSSLKGAVRRGRADKRGAGSGSRRGWHGKGSPATNLGVSQACRRAGASAGASMSTTTGVPRRRAAAGQSPAPAQAARARAVAARRRAGAGPAAPRAARAGGRYA